MINIKLNNLELVTLSLHLNIMRKSIIKGFKKTYDKAERKKHMGIYDSIAENLGNIISNIDNLEQESILTLNVDKDEMRMLFSFLEWYIQTLSVQAKEQQIEVDAFEILSNIFEKLKEKMTLMYFQQV